jgi:ribonuclease D
MSGALGHVQLHLVNDMDKLAEFKTWLSRKRQILAVDTETTGFSHERDHIRMVQFGDLDNGWAIPYQRWGGAALEVLTTYEGPLVLHN